MTQHIGLIHVVIQPQRLKSQRQGGGWVAPAPPAILTPFVATRLKHSSLQ